MLRRMEARRVHVLGQAVQSVMQQDGQGCAGWGREGETGGRASTCREDGHVIWQAGVTTLDLRSNAQSTKSSRAHEGVAWEMELGGGLSVFLTKRWRIIPHGPRSELKRLPCVSARKRAQSRGRRRSA